MKPLDVLIALTVPLVWGMGLVIAKPAVDAFPPILLMAFRFTLSALMLVWFVPIPRGILVQLFWVALIGSAVQYGLTFNGLRFLEAGTAALIVQAEVPFCTLLAAVWLKERVGARKIAGMLIAFAGVYLIAGEPRLQGQMAGVALVLGGAFTWAVGQVMMRRLGAVGGFTAIAWISVFAGPQLFVASLLVEAGHLEHIRDAPASVWSAIVYLAVIMNIVGYGCWYHVLGRYEVQRAAPYLLLLPVASLAGGAVFLGETPGLLVLLGGAVVIGGVAMIVVERTTQTARRPPA